MPTDTYSTYGTFIMHPLNPRGDGGDAVLEIRFHGRGGQGAVVASEILALAVFREGRYVQSFPFFGVERRGAPVTAYTRIDDRPIRIRSNIYEPHHVVVLDAGLLQAVDVTQGLREGGTLLVNAEREPAALDLPPRVRLAVIDATAVAMAHGLGSRTAPLVNTAILGAFVRLVDVASLDALLDAIKEEAPSNPEGNAAAARDAYDAVVLPEVVA
jgi:2-oxoacid:acceptor oxidoreductase gamma subunit (pyruvate/2-ketoisovalerate family)